MNVYKVYKNASEDSFLLDVQTDLLSGLNTRVVVPLIHLRNSPKPATYLNPIFEIDGHEVVMLTQFIAAVPESELTQEITNLRQFHNEIRSALDTIFSGF